MHPTQPGKNLDKINIDKSHTGYTASRMVKKKTAITRMLLEKSFLVFFFLQGWHYCVHTSPPRTIIYLSIVYTLGQVAMAVSAIHDITDTDKDGTPDDMTFHMWVSVNDSFRKWSAGRRWLVLNRATCFCWHPVSCQWWASSLLLWALGASNLAWLPLVGTSSVTNRWVHYRTGYSWCGFGKENAWKQIKTHRRMFNGFSISHLPCSLVKSI